MKGVALAAGAVLLFLALRPMLQGMTSSRPSSGGGEAPPPPVPPAAVPTIKANILSAAGGADLLRADEWAWYYRRVRGLPEGDTSVPDPLVVWPNLDRTTYKMTFDEWWAGVAAHGLQGLGGYIDWAWPPCVYVAA